MLGLTPLIPDSSEIQRVLAYQSKFLVHSAPSKRGPSIVVVVVVTGWDNFPKRNGQMMTMAMNSSLYDPGRHNNAPARYHCDTSKQASSSSKHQELNFAHLSFFTRWTRTYLRSFRWLCRLLWYRQQQKTTPTDMLWTKQDKRWHFV